MRKAKEYPMPEVRTKFTFRTRGMEQLFAKILAVQLKDGQYKNGWWGSHKNEWAYYTQAELFTGEVTKLEGLPVGVIKLTGFSRMLPIIGQQMVEVVRQTEGDAANIETVRKYLQEISKAIRDAQPTGKPENVIVVPTSIEDVPAGE
jgi:hypothetical protein